MGQRNTKGKQKENEELKQILTAEEHRTTTAYYPHSPQYKPVYEEPPTMVRDLPLEPTQEGHSDHNRIGEEKRKMLELLNKEFDLDYYSELDSNFDTYYRYQMLV